MVKPRAAAKAGGGRVVKKIDYVKLRQLINEGKNADEITKAFDLKSKMTLRTATMKLSMMDKKLYEVDGLFGRGATSEVKYGKFGVRLSPTALGGGFRRGDKFHIELKEGEILLKRV